jgi:hypothetical protein
VTCLRSTKGAGLIVSNSNFANNVDAGLQALEITPTFIDNPAPRLCWRGIQVDGDEWTTISGCRFWGLGDANYDAGSGAVPYYTGAPYEVDFLVRFRAATGEGGGTVFLTSESGHSRFVNNTIEWCASAKSIQIWGAPSVLIASNVLGLSPSPNAIGEGVIYITDADDGGTGTDVARDTLVVGNSIHNPSMTGTDASGLFARQCSDLGVRANYFGVVGSKFAIELAGSTCESVVVVANSFRGSGAACIAPVHVNTGTGVTNGLFVGGNDTEGFLSDNCVQNDSSTTTDYYLHGLRDKLSGDQSAAFLYAGVDVAVTDADTITSSAAFGGLAVGDLISINGFTGAGITANRGTFAVKTFTSSSSMDLALTTQGAVTLVADAAGETVTIRKLKDRPFSYAGTDVDVSDTDTIISTAHFNGLRVGDKIVLSGSGTAGNNGVIRTITVFTSSSSIDVLPASLTADATGTVTIRKVAAQPFDPFVYTATTLAAGDTDTITDSANLLGALKVGDAVMVNGFTGLGAVTNNGVIRYVTTVASNGSTIDVSDPVLTADAAGELVTIRKVALSVSANVSLD